MADGLQVPYTESSGTFTPPTGWYHNLVKNTNGSWTLTFKNQSKYQPKRFEPYGKKPKGNPGLKLNQEEITMFPIRKP